MQKGQVIVSIYWKSAVLQDLKKWTSHGNTFANIIYVEWRSNGVCDRLY